MKQRVEDHFQWSIIIIILIIVLVTIAYSLVLLGTRRPSSMS